MYSNSDATQPVNMITEGATYDVHDGISRRPEIPNVPYLDVVAAERREGYADLVLRQPGAVAGPFDGYLD